VRAEQLTGPCATHGEGPVWDAAIGRLRWVDLLSGDVLTLDAAGAIERLHVGDVAAAVRPRADGGLVVAVERGFAVLDARGRIVREHSAFGDPACRMNDGGADRQGRFFCGSMAYNMTDPRGALYRYDPDGTVAVALTGITISNGIAWSADGSRMYYIDSVTQRVDVLDYDTISGMPRDRRPLVRVDPGAGMPDGMALDSEGGLWVALWRGGAVHRYRQDGRLDAVAELPVGLVTACAFGGPDLDELYITTSREGLPPGTDSAAGAVFVLRPGVRGLPAGVFTG
jgi:sugar lactone lactonase YvrE